MRIRTLALSSLTALGIIVGAVEINNATNPPSTIVANPSAQSKTFTPTPSPGTGSTDPTQPATTSPAPQTTTKTIQGDTVTTDYGDVQIEATVTGSKITDIRALKTPNQDGHSRRIASFAIPQLISETLTNQNGNISNISGATYTSEGFKTSLQSILNKMGK